MYIEGLVLFIIVLVILFRSSINFFRTILGSELDDSDSLEQRVKMPKRKTDMLVVNEAGTDQSKRSKTKGNSRNSKNIKQNSSSKRGSAEIAEITHNKNTSGSDNWNKFLVLIGSTSDKNVKLDPTVKPSQWDNGRTNYSRDVTAVRRAPKSNNPTHNTSSLKENLCVKDKQIDQTKSNLNQGWYRLEKDQDDNNEKAKPRPIVSSKLNSGPPKLTKQIAIDCEMVGVDVGVNNDMLARVSLVNYEGNCVYDKFVKPTEPVKDYRTRVSGVRPKDLENATNFETVQREVSDIISGRVLVGHALKNDLKVLFLTHPKYLTRDTSKFKKFREGRTPALKNLAKKYLGVEIQAGEHSSIQDALAAMQLYRMFRKEWELSIKTRKTYSDVRFKANQAVPSNL